MKPNNIIIISVSSSNFLYRIRLGKKLKLETTTLFEPVIIDTTDTADKYKQVQHCVSKVP